MADRSVNNPGSEVPEMPEILERILIYALDEGKKQASADGGLVPFTALVVKDNVFLEGHPGNTSTECFNLAQHTVEGARGADAYAFCYDGYVETNEGVKDALIAEGGLPGLPKGHAVGILYTKDPTGNFLFNANPSYIGEAPNFMEHLKDATEYSEVEIDERYSAEE